MGKTIDINGVPFGHRAGLSGIASKTGVSVSMQK